MSRHCRYSFLITCPKCGHEFRVKKVDLLNQVLGVGVNVYDFDQYCVDCGERTGTWTAVQRSDDSTTIEMLYRTPHRPQVWKTTVFMNPPRDRRSLPPVGTTMRLRGNIQSLT